MIDIPTLADVKKQENELIAKKEAEQLVAQKFFIDKTQKALDNIIDACLEKAKQGEIQFEHQKFVEVFKFYDQLPACVDKDTIHTVVNELRKAGFEVEYEIESMMTSDFSYIRSLTIKW
jgi:hypothetical protein